MTCAVLYPKCLYHNMLITRGHGSSVRLSALYPSIAIWGVTHDHHRREELVKDNLSGHGGCLTMSECCQSVPRIQEYMNMYRPEWCL